MLLQFAFTVEDEYFGKSKKDEKKWKKSHKKSQKKEYGLLLIKFNNVLDRFYTNTTYTKNDKNEENEKKRLKNKIVWIYQ